MYQFPEIEDSPQIEVCDMKTKFTTLGYMWKLRSNLLAGLTYGKIISPQFYANLFAEPSWYLSIKNSNFNRKYHSIYLNISAREKLQVRGQFRIYLYSNQIKVAKTDWINLDNIEARSAICIEDFMEKTLLRNLAHNNLQLLCQIIYTLNDVAALKEILKLKELKNKLTLDLACPFKKEIFCDINFLVEGFMFPAHKAILAARSKGFAALFDYAGKWHKNDYIVIYNVNCEVFYEMLTYIYTDKAPNLAKFAGSLLAAAKTYGLLDLQIMCVQSLKDNLSIESCVGILILADQLSSFELKARAIDFINLQFDDIVKTRDWQHMLIYHHHLIFEIYEALAKPTSPYCIMA